MKHKFIAAMLFCTSVLFTHTALAACQVANTQVPDYYWGTATCQGNDSWTLPHTLSKWFSSSPQRSVKLTEAIDIPSPFGYVEEIISCWANLPNTHYATVQQLVCDQPTVVATADILDDRMLTHVSACNWSGWLNYTYRTNTLYCAGQSVATVSQSQATGQCYANVSNGYTKLLAGMGDCHVQIRRQ